MIRLESRILNILRSYLMAVQQLVVYTVPGIFALFRCEIAELLSLQE
jgi:hypothetical protein